MDRAVDGARGRGLDTMSELDGGVGRGLGGVAEGWIVTSRRIWEGGWWVSGAAGGVHAADTVQWVRVICILATDGAYAHKGPSIISGWTKWEGVDGAAEAGPHLSMTSAVTSRVHGEGPNKEGCPKVVEAAAEASAAVFRLLRRRLHRPLLCMEDVGCLEPGVKVARVDRLAR